MSGSKNSYGSGPRLRCSGVVLLAGLAMVVAEAGAQAGAPLSREAAVDLFVEQNPDLEAARNEVERIRAGQVGARLRPNPELTIAAENFRLSGSTPFSNLYEVSASYAETIELGGKRSLRTVLADLDASVAQANYDVIQRQGVFELEQAYLEALWAREQRVIALAASDSFAELVETSEIRLEEGVVSEGDVIRLRLEAVAIERAVRQATLALEHATIRIAERLGGTDFDAWTVTGDLDMVAEVPGLDVLREAAMTSSPELLAAQLEADRAQQSIAHERARAAPDLQPFVGYKRVASSNALLFGISIPLNFRNRNEGGIAGAVAEQRGSEARVRAVRNRVLAEVETAYRAWESASQQVARFEQDLLVGADDAQEITRVAYEEGVAELITVLDAERVRADVRTAYSDARFDYALSILELERAAGRDIEQ